MRIYVSGNLLFEHDDKQGDECGGLAEFESGSSVNYSFSNFSFKVFSSPLIHC